LNSTTGTLDHLLEPLERTRRLALQTAARVDTLRGILTSRERRVTTQALIGASVTAMLTAFAPMVLFTLSPAVLGVPHVVSDIRYLIVRQRLAHGFVALLVGFCALLFSLRLMEMTSLPSGLFAQVEIGAVAIWLSAAAFAGYAVSRSRIRLLGTCMVLAPLTIVALAYPVVTRLVFAHLHNVVALVVWALLFKRQAGRRLSLLPLSVVAAFVLFFLSARPHGADHAFGMTLADAAAIVAPGVSGDLGIGLASTYVFLQGVHYAIWLNFIPQEHIQGESTLTFRMSLRSLVRDLGRPALVVAAVFAVGMLAASVMALHQTRAIYLSLATFHGYLELAMLTYFVAAARSASP
jgi:hypothetical protein